MDENERRQDDRIETNGMVHETANEQAHEEPVSRVSQTNAAAEQPLYRSGEYAGAGTGEKFTLDSQPQASQPFSASSTSQSSPNMQAQTGAQAINNQYTPPQKQKEKKKFGTGTLALLLVLCIAIGLGSGIGGAFLVHNIWPTIAPSRQVVVKQVDAGQKTEIDEDSLAGVIARIANTVVEIRTEKVVTGSFFQNYVSEGAGSGVIISADGYIITNNHVISGADSIVVHLKDGTEYTAQLIATDSQTDIAVVKVDASGLEAATIGSSENLVVGETAIALGNPLGELGGSVSKGIISALDREITISGQTMRLLQTDAAINPGNSGGGLFNASGELIGIVNAKSTGDAIEGLGFAIPIDNAYEVAKELIEKGRVTGRPALGISAIDIQSESDMLRYSYSEIGRYLDGYGVYVYDDSQDNFQMGDKIMAIDDTTVTNMASISEILNEHAIGDTVTVTFSRGRMKMTVEVTLIEKDAA
ncbi:MAG: trypsin-like serine protease [Clostridiales bacterium]|nr:trypsin-like serine protease [Clostridiales bacterium]